MVVQIDRLRPGMWQTLRDLRLASLTESPTAFWACVEDETEFDERQWSRFLHAAAWFVAEREGKTIAIVGGLRRPEAPDEPEVIGMWVAPRFRRNGIAGALLDAVRDWAATRQARSLSLWVIDGNDPARELYERHGFQPTGERAPLPHDPDRVEARWRIFIHPNIASARDPR